MHKHCLMDLLNLITKGNFEDLSLAPWSEDSLHRSITDALDRRKKEKMAGWID